MTVLCGCGSCTGPASVLLATIEVDDPHELFHVLPGRKARNEVVPDDEARLSLDAIPGDKVGDRVDGIGRSAPLDLSRIDDELLVALDGKTQHCQAVLAARGSGARSLCTG